MEQNMAGSYPYGATDPSIYDCDPGYDDEDYYDAADGCDHEDADQDILTGRAHCHRCGHAWWMTSGEINAALRHHAEYEEWAWRESRRQWWRDQFDRIAFWRRWRKPVKFDDDNLPF
jgi:hypothetical protein